MAVRDCHTAGLPRLKTVTLPAYLGGETVTLWAAEESPHRVRHCGRHQQRVDGPLRLVKVLLQLGHTVGGLQTDWPTEVTGQVSRDTEGTSGEVAGQVSRDTEGRPGEVAGQVSWETAGRPGEVTGQVSRDTAGMSGGEGRVSSYEICMVTA